MRFDSRYLCGATVVAVSVGVLAPVQTAAANQFSEAGQGVTPSTSASVVAGKSGKTKITINGPRKAVTGEPVPMKGRATLGKKGLRKARVKIQRFTVSGKKPAKSKDPKKQKQSKTKKPARWTTVTQTRTNGQGRYRKVVKLPSASSMKLRALLTTPRRARGTKSRKITIRFSSVNNAPNAGDPGVNGPAAGGPTSGGNSGGGNPGAGNPGVTTPPECLVNGQPADAQPRPIQAAVVAADGSDALITVQGTCRDHDVEIASTQTVTLRGVPTDGSNAVLTAKDQSGVSQGRIINNQGGLIIKGALSLTEGVAPLGGGIRNDGGTLTLQDNVLMDRNTATNLGGAIYNRNGGSVTLKGDATVSANRAREGGGLYSTNSGVLQFAGNAAIKNNEATAQGGGIYNNGTLTTTPTASAVITGNTVTDPGSSGGGVYNTGTMIVEGVEIASNSAGFSGGGISNDNGGVSILRGTNLKNNSALNGGGIYNRRSVLQLDEAASQISKNDARVGGGIYTSEGPVELTNQSTVSDNTAGISGGGIAAYGSVVTVDNATIRGNKATVQHGGGLLNGGGGSVELKNGASVRNNESGQDGGGVHNFFSSELMMSDDSKIEKNKADRGGGIFSTGSSVVTLKDLAGVRFNDARNGGGIYNDEGTVTLKDEDGVGTSQGPVVAFNEATNVGGGIYNSADGTVSAEEGSQIVLNEALSGGGVFNKSGGELTGFLAGSVIPQPPLAGFLAWTEPGLNVPDDIYFASS